MAYNNKTETKFSYEVEILTNDLKNYILGEFPTVKEARAKIKIANLQKDTLVTIWKYIYSEQSMSFNSAVIDSKLHSEFII
jgi:penicillin V acylase-like amidase (Ntn superfamily)